MQVVDLIYRNGFARLEKVQLDGGEIVVRKMFDPSASATGAAWGFGSAPSAEHDAELVEELRKRFVKEIKVQQLLAEEGLKVMPVLDSDTEGEHPWFTMPLAEKTYTAQIREDRQAGIPAVGPLEEILATLDELHRLGYVHRDLKPPNILFFDGAWRLGDFGLVGQAQHDSERLTNVLSKYGTAQYVAPEQYQNFAHATAASDIFSFGCIIHDFLVGSERLPYRPQTGPGPIGEVIESCTRDDPAGRPLIGDLRERLLAAVEQAGQDPAPQPEDELADLRRAPDEWTPELVERIVLLVHGTAPASPERGAALALFDDARVRRLHELDPFGFEGVARIYAIWAAEASTADQAQDTSEMLEVLFELGEQGKRAQALLALSRIGVRHGDFYAMDTLHDLCGAELDDNTARRISIDIVAEDRAQDFLACVGGIGKDASTLHPRIAKALAG